MEFSEALLKYQECLQVLNEIEEIILWNQLWIDLESCNKNYSLESASDRS